MNPPTLQPPARKWANATLIVIFCALLWLPTVDFFCNIDHSEPPGENRLPAKFPEIHRASLGDLRKFMAGWENYFNDHFGFRKRLIRWFMHWKLHLYHDHSVYNIITGRDHWLFWGELSMVEHYLGIAKFTPQELKEWQTLLEKRRDWLAQRGIKYLFVIPPDKQMIYPEELPRWLADAAPANRETKLDQFLKYMKANSTVQILDLRQPLLDAKKIAPTYLQNDSHWNLFGGFVACQEVIKALSPQLPDLPPLNLADFEWTNLPATGGDLAQMIGTDAPEKNYFRFQPKPPLPALRTNVDLNFPTAWGAKIVFTTVNPLAPLRSAVVFHDSFGFAWEPFLGYDFRRVVFEYENHDFNRSLILSNAPAVVINEILERYFNTHDPAAMLKADALP